MIYKRTKAIKKSLSQESGWRFKPEQQESLGGTAKPFALRKPNGYSAKPGPEAARRFATLQLMRQEAFGEQSLTVESCDNREREMRDWLQTKIDSEDRKLSRLGEKIIRAMTEYKEEWKLETREVDVNIAAGYEYRSMFQQLQADDLPRFEGRFKDLLNENTIREVANFQSQLARERESIKERITLLNESLTQIDYNAGRYITLEVQTSPDAASLAYQFGLEWGAVRSRSFRFVVIDEAFGRGSDESAQYGLQLFAQLNLQLLIVTPLQKIHIIEPFVSSVGFVHNKEGRNSELRNLTIEEYRTEKEKAVE